ncbi:MAG: SCO family protein [Bryobacteraceae bacterium]
MTRSGIFLAILICLTGCRSAAPLPSYGAIPEFQLTDQQNRPFHSSALNQHVWVADFIYTTCGAICPRLTSQMHDVQNAFAGSSVRLVSFTVDPGHDTPQQLQQYARSHGANEQMWYFLTGPVETLQQLDRNAFKLGNIDGSLQHSSRFVLVDEGARIRGYYDTSEADAISRLIGDIKTLLNSES